MEKKPLLPPIIEENVQDNLPTVAVVKSIIEVEPELALIEKLEPGPAAAPPAATSPYAAAKPASLLAAAPAASPASLLAAAPTASPASLPAGAIPATKRRQAPAPPAATNPYAAAAEAKIRRLEAENKLLKQQLAAKAPVHVQIKKKFEMPKDEVEEETHKVEAVSLSKVEVDVIGDSINV